MNPDRRDDPAFSPEGKCRILSMIKESLNTAFILCNFEYPAFGKEEFIAVFDQILPTALVLNFGYWPFYRFPNKAHLKSCVCQSFVLPCRHKYTKKELMQHQIDTPLEQSKRKFCQDNGACRPFRYSIQMLETFPKLPRGYSITIRIVMKFRTQTGRLNLIETEFFEINERYTVIEPDIRMAFNYIFPPDQILEPLYANVFDVVDWFRFDDRISTGFTIKHKEMNQWTLCAAKALRYRMRNDPFVSTKQKSINDQNDEISNSKPISPNQSSESNELAIINEKTSVNVHLIGPKFCSQNDNVDKVCILDKLQAKLQSMLNEIDAKAIEIVENESVLDDASTSIQEIRNC